MISFPLPEPEILYDMKPTSTLPCIGFLKTLSKPCSLDASSLCITVNGDQHPFIAIMSCDTDSILSRFAKLMVNRRGPSKGETTQVQTCLN